MFLNHKFNGFISKMVITLKIDDHTNNCMEIIYYKILPERLFGT